MEGSGWKMKRTPFLGLGTMMTYAGHRSKFYDISRTPCSCKISRSFRSNRGWSEYKQSPFWALFGNFKETGAVACPDWWRSELWKKGGFWGVESGGQGGFSWWWDRVKFFTQVLLKSFQSKCGWKFSGKVRLIGTRISSRVRRVDWNFPGKVRQFFPNQGLLGIFQSRSN
jgi:hypothetical protein